MNDDNKGNITVTEVKTRKDIKEFLDFPLRLYKNCPQFVPPLYADEKQMFRADYHYYSTCETVFFLAKRDGKTVGRIQGILQKASNEKYNQKRVRFTRFDCIEDINVADALFKALEEWTVSKGMDTVVGPLGFSDLEREGMLIEGFDKLATFEEQYNYAYYPDFVSKLGYEKEVDWTESMIFAPDPEQDDGKLERIAAYVMKKQNLHVVKTKSTKEMLAKYKDQLFNIIDRAYERIYGTVPFTEEMKEALVKNFNLVIDMNYISMVADENDRLVCFGLCFPSIAKAVQKSGGHLTPACLVRLLKAIKRPHVIDLALIGVDPDFENLGISAIVASMLKERLKKPGIQYAETNLNLEHNMQIQNLWKRFKEVKHKRRRSYVKKVG